MWYVLNSKWYMIHNMWLMVYGIWYILLEVQGSCDQATAVDISRL